MTEKRKYHANDARSIGAVVIPAAILVALTAIYRSVNKCMSPERDENQNSDLEKGESQNPNSLRRDTQYELKPFIQNNSNRWSITCMQLIEPITFQYSFKCCMNVLSWKLSALPVNGQERCHMCSKHLKVHNNFLGLVRKSYAEIWMLIWLPSGVFARIISSALSIFWRKIGLADLFFSRQFCSTFSEKTCWFVFQRLKNKRKNQVLPPKYF